MSSVFNPGRGPRPMHVEVEMAAIATELEALVDRMDDEISNIGAVTAATAEQLNALRRRFEKLFGSS